MQTQFYRDLLFIPCSVGPPKPHGHAAHSPGILTTFTAPISWGLTLCWTVSWALHTHISQGCEEEDNRILLRQVLWELLLRAGNRHREEEAVLWGHTAWSVGCKPRQPSPELALHLQVCQPPPACRALFSQRFHSCLSQRLVSSSVGLCIHSTHRSCWVLAGARQRPREERPPLTFLRCYGLTPGLRAHYTCPQPRPRSRIHLGIFSKRWQWVQTQGL